MQIFSRSVAIRDHIHEVNYNSRITSNTEANIATFPRRHVRLNQNDIIMIYSAFPLTASVM